MVTASSSMFRRAKIFLFGGVMSPNHGWADYCDWTARLLRGSATEDTARHTRLCGSLNTAWLDLVRGSQLTGRSCSSLARAVLENGTRHSTTWWRVYMQLSDDWLSLGRRPIVFNFALCSFFSFTYINMVVCADVLRSRFNFECTVMRKSSAELTKPPQC